MNINTPDGIEIYILPEGAKCRRTGISPLEMEKCPLCNFDDYGEECVPDVCCYYTEEGGGRVMKEYDCSKILDYTHEVQRFCKAHKIQGCDNCPMTKERGYCSASIFDITQERINFIQKWSDEHREKAREEENGKENT